MTDYPIIGKLDGGTFVEEQEDVAIPPADMEGGYVISRPRFTRAPRRTFSYSYTDVSTADKDIFMAFWANDAKGRSNAFNWTHPQTEEVINVRFGDMKCRFSRMDLINRWQSETVVVVEV